MKFQKELCLKVQFIMLHHPNSVENELATCASIMNWQRP